MINNQIASKVGHGRGKKEISWLLSDDIGLVVVSGLLSFAFALSCPTLFARQFVNDVNNNNKIITIIIIIHHNHHHYRHVISLPFVIWPIIQLLAEAHRVLVNQRQEACKWMRPAAGGGIPVALQQSSRKTSCRHSYAVPVCQWAPKSKLHSQPLEQASPQWPACRMRLDQHHWIRFALLAMGSLQLVTHACPGTHVQQSLAGCSEC